jgi:peptidoglycan hydrolase CwlO-like protein
VSDRTVERRRPWLIPLLFGFAVVVLGVSVVVAATALPAARARDDREARVVQLRKDIADLRGAGSRLQLRVESDQGQISARQTDVDEATKRAADDQDQLDRLEKRIKDLKKQIADVKG